ncbi:RidA family protein [Pseudomonas tolaasii]|uniref:RidA family protein n=2 Tax=Pseudomonas tolaasii TaxID=29442 RepID=A0A7Y8DS71_PSETO|nr:RidA family protein [Pseudomonas tolaasii]ARB30231.1 RidA family protein [Pseudomonas tolaasii]KAB0467138.1 RidA family protein [Pseudomonas tolaasii]MBY8943223.1 RidA family protein [Pseudomonas tolaasii]NVZ46762.1 RidA family protein [Pseudomonas tolaasii]NWA52171.1 RidA family protein [Pseudomonas tolaasii]
MFTRLNYSDRPAPTTQFSEAALVNRSTRLLITSGQIGVGPDGRLGETAEEQIDITWKNILQLLKEAGTSPEYIVKATTYLTSADDIAIYRSIRNRYIPTVRACSTLVIVPALADPGYKVEVELIVAVPDAA